MQNNPDLSISQKIIAWFRAAIRNIGKALPVMQRMQWFRAIDKMSVEDVVYAAQQALKSAPSTLRNAQDRGTFKSEMFSKSPAQQQAVAAINTLRQKFGKPSPDSEPASKYADQNRRIREEHITAWDKGRKWLKRQLTPGGLLPEAVFKQKI